VSFFESQSPQALAHMRIAVNFVGEDGIDCDGLSRELCDLVAEALVAPFADTGRPLFLLCSASGYSLPHPFADRIPLNPHLFRQLGIFFGKAVLDTLCGATRHIGLRLAPSFTKYLLDIPSDPADLQALDAMLYENLINHFLECNVQEYAQAVHMSDTLLFEDTIYNPDASFSGEQKTFRQLDPDTQQPRIVTEENKRDYILFLGTPHELATHRRLAAEGLRDWCCCYSVHNRLVASLETQLHNFRSGFWEILPPRVLCLFHSLELEVLLAGTSSCTAEEFIAEATISSLALHAPKKAMFIEAISTLTPAEMRRFLAFTTGSSTVPLGGFKNVMLQVQFDTAAPGTLPLGITCFNRLVRPVLLVVVVWLPSAITANMRRALLHRSSSTPPVPKRYGATSCSPSTKLKALAFDSIAARAVCVCV